MGRNPSGKQLLLFASAIALLATAGVYLFGSHSRGRVSSTESAKREVAGSLAQLYTPSYPANDKFKAELGRLLSTGKLTSQNEALIRRTADAVSHELKMPPAILWCLLFQESRLDHLAGVTDGKTATGLGQFSFSSFYEVNFNLDRFNHENVDMLVKTLGNDVRPVGAFRRDIFHPSSYYYIPTAVATSAAYLNNRYLQLSRALDRKAISYDPSLLWLYSTMAYNKGTRSVLSLWNDARRTGGKAKVEKIVRSPSDFFRAFEKQSTLEHALANIWPREEARLYARELKIHVSSMSDCAISDDEKLELGARLGRKGL